MSDTSRMIWVNPIVVLGALILLSDVVMVVASGNGEPRPARAKAVGSDTPAAETPEPTWMPDREATAMPGSPPSQPRPVATLLPPERRPGPAPEHEGPAPAIVAPAAEPAPALSERMNDNTRLLADALGQQAERARQQAALAEREGRTAEVERARGEVERAGRESERIRRIAEGQQPDESAPVGGPAGSADSPPSAPSESGQERDGPGRGEGEAPDAAP